MKTASISILAILALGLFANGAVAQDSSKSKPKNEITKVEHARKTDKTVHQVTPDPKKSPGKHAKNLSKNINHELNRESKDINKAFKHKKKK